MAALAGIITGLAMVFGLDQGTISNVAGALVSVASVVSYINAEGRVDAEGVKKAVEDVQSAIDTVSGTSMVVTKNTTVYDSNNAYKD